jgi:Hemerythrin HHE cation binding domain
MAPPDVPPRSVTPHGRLPADVIDLIMADHRRVRRLCEVLDDAALRGPAVGSGWALVEVWSRLAELLEAHMSAEEEICYLPMSRSGSVPPERRWEAVADHGDIREAIGEARLQLAGSTVWWSAARAVLAASADHLDREERGMIAGWLPRLTTDRRLELGSQWLAFIAARRLESVPVPRAGGPRARRAPGPSLRPGAEPKTLHRITA